MSIQKRKTASGFSYRVRVQVGFKADGSRAVESRTFKTKVAAAEWEAKMKALASQMATHDGSMTLRGFVERVWWPSLGSLAPSSRTTYEKELRLRIIPSLGFMRLRSIDRRAVQAMVDGCATAGVARKAVATLKTILNEAMHDGLIASNAACARFAMPPEGRPRDASAVVSTFAAMVPYIEAAREWDDESVLALMITGFLMGLRPEERYALDVASFSDDCSLCAVESAYTVASPSEGGNHMKAPKTPLSRRVAPVPPDAREDLRKLCEGREGAFITGAGGSRISPSTAQKRIRRFFRCHPDLPFVSIENMRHSFATAYLHAGGNVEDLSRILGHSDINTTFRRYVRPNPEDLASAAASVVKLGQ